jgi:glycogen operon protein
MNWRLPEQNADLLRFCRVMIRFRAHHPILRRPLHAAQDGGALDVSWHGICAGYPDWSPGSRVLAFLRRAPAANGRIDAIYVAINMHWETLEFELPAPPHSQQWHVSANTDMPAPEDAWEPGQEPPLADQGRILVGSRTLVILVAR